MQTILVVDDEQSIVEVLTDVLEYAGYRVLSAANGQAALTCLEQTPVDLVLSDVMMPQMDGRTLCQRIQTNPAHRRLPVILMSAARSGLKLEGCDYAALLGKPFEIDEVIRLVKGVLGTPTRQS